MQERLEKYVDLLLDFCLKIKKSSALLISIPAEHIELARIVASKAYIKGIKDIHFEFTDMYIKHEQLINLSKEELKKDKRWNKQVFNEYANKNASFLSFTTEYPGLMKDVDPKLISSMDQYVRTTTLEFDNARSNGDLAWCIAAVPSKMWAEKVFPNCEDSYQKLWDAIFDICLINEENPVSAWEQKIKHLKTKTNILNTLAIKSLHYTNSLGTDLTIELPKNHIWISASNLVSDGREVIFNMPSEEIFTVPKKDGANGIVYSSLPLIHNGVIINKFALTFESGKVVSVKAESGEEMLIEMIASDPKGNMLGEVALVPYDSPIRNSETIFYETLFDENASCHVALGQGYTNCITNYQEYTKEELFELGVNDALIHVDFMIGTADLDIIATTRDGKKIQIFKDGNYNI